MRRSEIVHFHVHSDYSILDGFATVDEIIDRAIEIGSRAVAITDHGNLHAAAELYFKAKNKNIKPIIGCEFYYIHSDTFENTREMRHLLLIAYNKEGYQNLLELSRLSYEVGFYYKPRINKSLLERYNRGLICTTGCIESVIPNLILSDRIEEAEKTLLYFNDLFHGRYYIEIQDHQLYKQAKLNKHLIDFHRKYKIPLLATNDTHYAYVHQAEPHDVMLAIQTNSKISDLNRLRFTYDNGNLNPNFYIKSAEELMRERIYLEYPESIKNTIDLAERCESDTMKVFEKMLMPKIEGYHISSHNFRSYVIQSAKERLGTAYNEEVEQRILYELSVIEKLGFVDYFIVVSYIVNLARNVGIWVGPGRGSVGGSMVAYALSITDINPMQYGLLFERFLNPDRVSPPDIDIDFEDSERDRLIELLRQVFGNDNVLHIATFGRIGMRMSLRDVGRVFDVPRQKIDEIIDTYFPQKQINLEELYKHLKEKQLLDKFDLLIKQSATKEKTFQDIIEIADKLTNRIRHVGMHASGILITPEPAHTLMPTFIVKKDNVAKKVVQFEYEYVEKMGGLKVDILGLSTLSVMKKVINRLNQDGIEVDMINIDLYDRKVYELFSSGLTGGIFQFESDGMRAYLKELKPDSIYDLIAMNALYRPGPLEQIPIYIRRKHKQEPISYPDPRTEPILKETYGIIVYQEQVMQIAQVIANYTLAEADLLRRAIGKKIKEIIEENRAKFIERAIANNVPRDVAKHIFHLIEQFADYGFNKSHATAYAYLAYQTAYLKTYYPEIYMSEIINTYKDSRDYIKRILYECEMMNIRVVAPSLPANKYTTSKNNSIILGLNVIKDIGDSNAEYIEKIQLTNDKSVDFRLISRTLNKKTKEALAKAGILDNYVKDRKTIELENMPTLFSLAPIQETNKSKDIDNIKEEIEALTRLTSTKYRMPLIIFYENMPSFLSFVRIEEFFKKYSKDNTLYTVSFLYDITKRSGLSRMYLSDDFGQYNLPSSINSIPDNWIGQHFVITIQKIKDILTITNITPWYKITKMKDLVIYIHVPQNDVDNKFNEYLQKIIVQDDNNYLNNIVFRIYDINGKDRCVVDILSGVSIRLDSELYKKFRITAKVGVQLPNALALNSNLT